MGVDYRENSGYGIIIPEEEVPGLAEKLGFVEPEEWVDTYEFGYWLVKDYTTLSSEMVGDYMNEEDLSLVIEVSRLSQKVSLYGRDPGVRKFSQVDVTSTEAEELYEVYTKLYGEPPGFDGLSWYMALTVS